MSGPGESTVGWQGLKILSFAVYLFMFAPIVVVVLLAFNSARSGSFPMEGVSLVWFAKLFSNESIVEAFKTLKEDLDKEKKAITKQWSKREEQIERVMQATVGMYGDLQGIAGKTLQEIEGLSLRALEAPERETKSVE